MKDIKPSEAAKEENEFQKLSEASLSDKDQEKYTKQFEQEAIKIPKLSDVLYEIGVTRHEFLLSTLDLQKVATEYQTMRQTDTENWAASKKQEYRAKVKEYHDKLKVIYKDQRIKQIKILSYHKNIELRLNFKFEVSQHNPYMISALAVKVLEYDSKVKPIAN